MNTRFATFAATALLLGLNACSSSDSAASDAGTGTDAATGSDAKADAPHSDAKADTGNTGAYALPAACGLGTDTYPCNPITNEGCDTAGGEACDFGQSGFECYPAPNDAKLGEACDVTNGPYCGPKLTCVGVTDTVSTGVCGTFCCADTDCTGTDTCVAFDPANSGALGSCGTATTADAGADDAATTDDAATDAATE